MNIETMFPKRWLSADDLAGKQVVVEVQAVTVQAIRNPRSNREEPRIVVAFVGKQKRLIVNKTQAYQLAQLANSRETDDWIGLRVALAAAPAPNGHVTIAVSRPLAETKGQP